MTQAQPHDPKPSSSTVSQRYPAVEEASGPETRHYNVPLSVADQEAILGSAGKEARDRGASRAVDGSVPTTRPTWYVLLDAEGHPTGPLLEEMPQGDDEPFIAVQLTPSTPADVLMTPSGAPLTERMNPMHSHYDAGLVERNPPPHVMTPHVGEKVQPKTPPKSTEPSKK